MAMFSVAQESDKLLLQQQCPCHSLGPPRNCCHPLPMALSLAWLPFHSLK